MGVVTLKWGSCCVTKLCQEVASECWDNELTVDFNELALECIEARVG